MFSVPLSVKVDNDVVTFAIRANDDRVEEFKFTVEEFKGVIESAKTLEYFVHVSVHMSTTHRSVFSVSRYAWDVMISEFRAQVGD